MLRQPSNSLTDLFRKKLAGPLAVSCNEMVTVEATQPVASGSQPKSMVPVAEPVASVLATWSADGVPVPPPTWLTSNPDPVAVSWNLSALIAP